MLLKGACTALIGTGPEMILIVMSLYIEFLLLRSSFSRPIQSDVVEVHLT
jgi:hypothetical protein